MCESYLKKSDSHLSSASLLLENGRLEEAVSMAYYSMYFALIALLFRAGIKCENHAASIMLLEEVFGIGNADISAAKDERISKQYYVDVPATRADVESLLRAAEGFNRMLFDVIARLTLGDIERSREKLRSLWAKRV